MTAAFEQAIEEKRQRFSGCGSDRRELLFFIVCMGQDMRTEFIGLFGPFALAGLALCALEVAALPTPKTRVLAAQAVAGARPNHLRGDGFHRPIPTTDR